VDVDMQNNLSPEEKQLLEEWILQLEKLKNELQILEQEGQCGIIISDVASKLAKIYTGIQLWKSKNIDKDI
jgi:hypothetical protein